MLASAADRDRAISVLKASFLEGRLTKDELELRVGQVLTAPLFTDVMGLTCDLPVGPLGTLPARPGTPAPPRTSRLAIAALVCAAAAPFTVGLSAIPAIVFGHVARRRLRTTGERGAAVASVAVVLGWLAVLIGAVTLLARHAV